MAENTHTTHQTQLFIRHIRAFVNKLYMALQKGHLGPSCKVLWDLGSWALGPGHPSLGAVLGPTRLGLLTLHYSIIGGDYTIKAHIRICRDPTDVNVIDRKRVLWGAILQMDQDTAPAGPWGAERLSNNTKWFTMLP